MREMATRHRRARIDGDDTHAMADAFAAQALREHIECNVGSAARDVPMIGVARSGPDDVDNDAALACTHPAIDDACEVDIAEDFYVPGIAPGFGIDFFDRAGRNVTRIVYQYVDVFACLAEGFDFRGEAEIAAMDAHLDVMFLNESYRYLLELRFIACRKAQVAALCRHMFRDDKADALGGAGDQDGLA